MKLYLIQHGEAKPETEDPQRSLTEKGKEEIKKISEAAKKLNIHPSKVFHSGKLRAKETAEIIAEVLRFPKPSVQVAHGLNPNDNIRPWAERISKEKEDLMLIGHLPFLDKLASFLICGDETARVVLFRNGAMVCLDQKEDKNWAVRWILVPGMA